MALKPTANGYPTMPTDDVTPCHPSPTYRTVTRVYLVRGAGDPVWFARSVRARTEYHAAEDYVAEMCDSGVVAAVLGETRTVIVTAQDGRDIRYTVTTEWKPKFVAVPE